MTRRSGSYFGRVLSALMSCVLFSGLATAPGCHSGLRASASAPQARAGADATASRGAPAPRPAAINHLAFFKLNDPADAAALIADCDQMLGNIPGVVAYYAGQHLDTGRGERIDSNYDVAFYVGFENEADYAAYVEHPRHKAMLQKWQPRWTWIRVIDVLDPTP